MIEIEEAKKIAHLRALVDSSIASGMPSEGSIKIAMDSFDNYRNMALPYMTKTLTMEEDRLKQERLKHIKEVHAINKEVFEKLKEMRKL